MTKKSDSSLPPQPNTNTGHLIGGFSIFNLWRVFQKKPQEEKFDAKKLHRPMRVPKMENKVYESLGSGKLEEPDPKVVQMIEAEEPKVHYFPVARTPEFAKNLTKMQNSDDFYNTVLLALDARIKRDFPNRVVALRGIQAALNGSIENGDMIVLDAVDIVGFGKEASMPGVTGVRVESGYDTLSSDSVTKDFPGLYAALNDRFRTLLRATGRQNEVFPAMLVYDEARLDLSYSRKQGYWRHFDGRPYDAVLGLYILDAPLFK